MGLFNGAFNVMFVRIGPIRRKEKEKEEEEGEGSKRSRSEE